MLRQETCLRIIALYILGLSTTNAFAHEVSGERPEFSRKWAAIGVGAGYVRFDTNFTFKDKSSGLRVAIDGEGSLGLPEKKGVPVLYGNFRIANRHYFGFSYFKVKRVATLAQVNESKDFHLGDLTITAGANAKVELTDNTSFYYLSYNYALFDDNRSILLATFGLYGLDLKYTFDANGEITIQGIPVVEESFRREASVFAPLPMVGINAWYFFTPKWALGTRLTIVGGSYEDISAAVLDTTIQAKYQFRKWIGFTFGITYFNAEIIIDKPDLQTEVDYGFDGVALGLDIGF